MPANWSLILNVLLLIGVIVAIGRLMKARRQSLNYERYQPTLGKKENSPYDAQPLHDDIIAVRKVNKEAQSPYPDVGVEQQNASRAPQPQLMPEEPSVMTDTIPTKVKKEVKAMPATVMMFLLAKQNRQFAGYELLQTLLSSGLRFGEGHLFHRHQLSNGQGPILCSLAAATATGIFDLQNIGAFSVRGLCIFMHSSNDYQINTDRFSTMLETAKQLSEGLDALLLDDQRKPLNAERISRYYAMLHMEHEEPELALA
jgi:cell division protein ZipA